MSTDRPDDLDSWSKGDLAARAEALGVDGASKFTKVELIDEIRRVEGAADRGFLGKARDMLRGVVEKGLARALGNEAPRSGAPVVGRDPSSAGEGSSGGDGADALDEPLVSRTLVEIHLAQGDRRRARALVDALLRANPGDTEAQALLAQIDQTLDDALGSAGSNDARRADDVDDEDDEHEAAEPGEGADADVDLEALHATLAKPAAEAILAAPAEPPVPARYDVDECVAMPVDARTLYVYWETRVPTVARARRVLGAGASPTLRVLVVEPTAHGPVVSTRDLPIADDALAAGETFVRELPPGAILRTAIGLAVGERFLPIAHTTDVESPPDAPSPVGAHEVRAWEPPAPYAADAPHAPGAPRHHAPSRSHAIERAELPHPVSGARPDFSESAAFGEAAPRDVVELPPEILGRGLSSAELADQRRRIQMGAGAPPAHLGRAGAAGGGAGAGASELWAQPTSAAWASRG
jgi:phage tail protein X